MSKPSLFLQLNTAGAWPATFWKANPAQAVKRAGRRSYVKTAVDDPLALVWDPTLMRVVELRSFSNIIIAPLPDDPGENAKWEDWDVLRKELLAHQNDTEWVVNGGTRGRNFKVSDANRAAGKNGLYMPYDSDCVFTLLNIRGVGAPQGTDGTGATYLIGGYRFKLILVNARLEVEMAFLADKSAGRHISADECKRFEAHNCTFIGGRGIYIRGHDGQWNGNTAAGDRIVVEQCDFINLNGCRSDGAGSYKKTNWGYTHIKNTTRINGGGEIGWEVANAVQINECCNIGSLSVARNRIIGELGKMRIEDAFSCVNGSGCKDESSRGYWEDNVIWNPGGWDWTYQPGVSLSYNGSNQITAGATSFQDVTKTSYSGTCGLWGDNALTDVWANNTGYMTIRRNVCFGFRAIFSQQAGHYLIFDSNVMYLCDRDLFTGVLLPGAQATLQVSDYRKATASDTNTPIWMNNTYSNNIIYNLAAGSNPSTQSTDLLDPKEGGSNRNGSQPINNLRMIRPADGGLAAYNAAMANAQGAGYSYGTSLPIAV